MFQSVFKAVVLFLILTAFSNSAYADNKVVRVGWYESPFNYTDSFGRRSGYAYDYQQKVAAYTGWTYEYIKGSWPELYTMLLNGQIDILSDVSKTPERAGLMLFPSLPMGAESYYLYILSSNDSIKIDNLSSLNGKKVGVNANSYQGALFTQWMRDNSVNAQLIGLNDSEKIAFEKVANGELDAYITLDCYEDEITHSCVPILEIGHSEFFFAVNKNRPDLLNELNFAMSKINDENKFYDDYLYSKYLKGIGTNAFISNDELKWLAQHKTIRVGYLKNFSPFCDSSMTGGLTGVLKNYLELAANCTKNAVIEFDTKSYSTLKDAFQALADNEIDCVFPVNLSIHDAESMGIMTTNPFLQTEMKLMINKSSKKVISEDQQIVVAINGDNVNYKTFLMDNYPNWKILECSSFNAALEAVESSQADCVLVHDYQVEQLTSDKYDFYALTTGKALDFSFAIRRSEPELYYILNKTASLVPSASLQSALIEYSSSKITFSFGEFLRRYVFVLIALGLAVAIGIVIFIKRQAKRKEEMLRERLKVQEKQIENERRASEINSITSTISADYRSIYSVNLEENEGCCYRAKSADSNNESDLEGIKVGDRFPFRENFVRYANKFVAESDRKEFLKFLEPKNIREKLSKEVMTGHRYRIIRDGVEQYEMIRIVDAYLGKARDRINFISVGFADVDSETRDLIEENRSLSEALKNSQKM
ncbi:MAG: transporter substrate-binding domain-containing protein [Selenomonadaceae bacterium]|nr:transporter substrate-binding domain-containing protein [Selenomonadaceae bacterium]